MDQATPRRSFKIKAGCILGASVSDGSSSLIKYEPDIELLHTLLIQEAPFEEIVRAANGLVLRMVTVPNCKYVPEVMGMSTGPFVLSPAIRAIIDEMEPGVHTYLPITVVSDKKIQSATEHGTHFMLVPPPPIDCIILDESVMKADIQGYPKKKEGDHWGGGIAFTKTLVLDGSIIGSRHLWRTQTGNFKQVYSKYSCSEEFWKRYKGAKMRGWDCRIKCQIKYPV